MKKSNNYCAFWRHISNGYNSNHWKMCFSQWYPSGFIGGEHIFNNHDFSDVIDIKLWNEYVYNNSFQTAEHWMMILKGLLFTKGKFYNHNLEIIYKMYDASPKDVKNMGRNIKGFNQTIWDKWSSAIVVYGNYLKFSQNEDIKINLLRTNKKHIVEASPYDRIWGIGYREKDMMANYNNWGANKLGKALMEVRDILLKL